MSLNFPNDLKYTRDHEWIRLEDGIAYIGITDFAQSELGDIVYVDINAQAGDSREAGEVFGTVEAVKTVSDLFMPVSGTIMEINSEIDADPSLVNSDPYGQGWIIKISIDKSSELKDLLSSEAYSSLVQ